MRRVRTWALAGLAAALLTVPAAAQDPETAPPPGGYTGAKLGEALKKLGYNAELQAGFTDAYVIPVAGGNTTLYTRVSLSSDRTYLWLRTVVLDLPDAARANPEAIRRLIQENDVIGPARYSYSDADKQVRISRHLANRDLTPVKMRKALEEFDGLVRKQEPLWQKDNFIRIGGVPADVAARDLDQFQGEWKFAELWNLDVRVPDENLKKVNGIARFEGTKLRTVIGGKTETATIAVDPRGTPGRIDLIGANGRVTPGVYRLDNDTLTVYFVNAEGGNRPTDPEMKPSKTAIKFVLKRTPNS